MKPGSVIVDLAAERGGNTVGCVPGEHVVLDNGVHIIGYTDLPSRLPAQSSTMISNNIHNFLKQISPNEELFDYNLQHDLTSANYGKVEHIVRGSIVTHNGETLFPPPRCDPPPAPVSAQEVGGPSPEELQIIAAKKNATSNCAKVLGGYGAMAAMGGAPAVPWLTIGLSTATGSGLVVNVLPALHSPLMAVTNAISGLTAVGGLVQLNGAVAATSAGAANTLALSATALS